MVCYPWVMQGNKESRVATNRMMIARSKALADSGAGIREQSAGMCALLERQSWQRIKTISTL